MGRATLSPIIQACLNIAGTVGTPNILVGDGVAPDCDAPYIVVNAVSIRPYSGPLSDPEADSSDRIQFAFIGPTREAADDMRDDIRLALTFSALDAEFIALTANRRTLKLKLDIGRAAQRDDRGLPNPIFTGMDQYIINTTPSTP